MLLLQMLDLLKKSLLKNLKKILRKEISCIPGHPIAGTEESGPKSGLLNLFKKRWFIGRTCKLSKKKDQRKIERLWIKFGSKVTSMSAGSHDSIMAITSHIPHLIAYNIVGTASS